MLLVRSCKNLGLVSLTPIIILKMKLDQCPNLMNLSHVRLKSLKKPVLIERRLKS